MNSKKRLLVAGVVAAIALLAVPALALASVWKDKGTNVTKFVEIGLTGGEIFEYPPAESEEETGSGMSCAVHATLATEGGSTGEITEWKVEECPTGFGSFAKCEFKTATAKGLPWTVHVNTSDLTITNMRIKRTFDEKCATTLLDKTVTSTTVTLDSTTAITEVEFLGEASEYKAFGSFTVDSPDSGTYGIG